MKILGHFRTAVTLEIFTAADDTSRRDAAVACGGAPATLTIRGTVTVNGNLFVTDQTTGGPWFTDGLNAACGANPPQQLTVEDGSHTVLGRAILALGHMDSNGNCHITFTIRNVQARKAEYGFSVPSGAPHGCPALRSPDRSCWPLDGQAHRSAGL